MFYRVAGGRDPNCNIVWVSADVMNGPAYTDDQYLVNTGASPTFGRYSNDKIESYNKNTWGWMGCGLLYIGTGDGGGMNVYVRALGSALARAGVEWRIFDGGALVEAPFDWNKPPGRS